MSFKNILKIFLLDWIVTVVMYLVGLLITGIGDLRPADIVFYLSNLPSSPNGTSPLLDVLSYLMVSLGFVVLISYLVNKSYLKLSIREFVVAQVTYIISPLLLIFTVFLTL